MITLMLALLVAVMPASEPEPATPSGDQYAETWAWCADRFPGQPDMQDACRWGAFEMLPTIQQPTTEWRA